MKMYDIMREIVFYCMWLWILLVVSYNFRDPNAFLLRDSLTHIVSDQGLGHIDTFYYDLKKVRYLTLAQNF